MKFFFFFFFFFIFSINFIFKKLSNSQTLSFIKDAINLQQGSDPVNLLQNLIDYLNKHIEEYLGFIISFFIYLLKKKDFDPAQKNGLIFTLENNKISLKKNGNQIPAAATFEYIPLKFDSFGKQIQQPGRNQFFFLLWKNFKNHNFFFFFLLDAFLRISALARKIIIIS